MSAKELMKNGERCETWLLRELSESLNAHQFAREGKDFQGNVCDDPVIIARERLWGLDRAITCVNTLKEACGVEVEQTTVSQVNEGLRWYADRLPILVLDQAIIIEADLNSQTDNVFVGVGKLLRERQKSA